MSQPQNETRKETLLLHKKIVFEIVEKQVYDKQFNVWDDVVEIKINDKEYTTMKVRDFDVIIKHLAKKVDVLKYVLDDTYSVLADDILFDIGLILYKLSKGDAV
jgi:hypothetical protein